MLKQRHRFHGHASLKYVFNKGAQARSRLLSVRCVANSRRRYSRISVVVSKKVLKHAVDRNRARRRVYEAMRLELPKFTGVYDVAVVLYSPDILTISHSDLLKQLQGSLQKLTLI